jgi:hypothetical protein
MNPLDIVLKFVLLLDKEKDYAAAASLLADDDFEFDTPKDCFHSKNDWLERFPGVHAGAPVFEPPILGAEDNQILRKGKKKLGFLTLSMVETYDVNEEGKITRISAAKA